MIHHGNGGHLMEKEWEAEALEAWKRLSIQDNFIFQRVMQNVKLCKWLLERILKIKIREIRYPDTEKSISIRLDSKAIRLDVYVEDEIGTVYNIEMQTTKGHDGELARRTRYYQGMIDMDLLRKGVYYDDLRQTYIIFICTFDLFGMDERIYTFRNQCMEQPELELGDGTTKIFLNAKGLKGRVDEDLEDFLQYVDGKPARSRFTQEMAQEVESVKRQDEMRREFVTLYMEYQKQRREGAAEGFERGRREGREEGIAEGRTEGRMIGTMRTALKFMNAGTPLKTAAKIADVPEEELRDFAKRNGVSIL